jgi:hypothetical protein
LVKIDLSHEEGTMATLRIEHAIYDYESWREAFDGFAEAALAGAAQTRILDLRQSEQRG